MCRKRRENPLQLDQLHLAVRSPASTPIEHDQRSSATSRQVEIDTRARLIGKADVWKPFTNPGTQVDVVRRHICATPPSRYGIWSFNKLQQHANFTIHLSAGKNRENSMERHCGTWRPMGDGSSHDGWSEIRKLHPVRVAWHIKCYMLTLQSGGPFLRLIGVPLVPIFGCSAVMGATGNKRWRCFPEYGYIMEAGRDEKSAHRRR